MKAPARRTAKTARKAPSRRAAIRIKRAYDAPDAADGMRILIDRLWPRGIAKQELAHELWVKDLAPSNELRRWYGHAPERFAEFRRRYLAELEANGDKLAQLRAATRGRTVTLVTATRELDLSHATVLRDVLLGKR
jgi:uncharacterized protein YeaO (DUF488 family)